MATTTVNTTPAAADHPVQPSATSMKHSTLEPLHLPTSVEAHLPEHVTHLKARKASVAAYEAALEADIAKANTSAESVTEEKKGELEEKRIELEKIQAMTEHEKERYIGEKTGSKTEGWGRRKGSGYMLGLYPL